MTTPPSSEHPNPHQPGATPSPHTPQPQQPISGAPAEPYKSDVPPQPHQPAPGQPMDPYQQAGAQPGAQQPGYPQPEYQYQYAGYGGYSPQQAAYPHPGYAPYQQSGTNVMAILSLVFAFVFSPAGIVLGHVAKKQIRQTGEQGMGLATAGLVLSYIFTGLIVLGCCLGFVAALATGDTSTY